MRVLAAAACLLVLAGCLGSGGEPGTGSTTPAAPRDEAVRFVALGDAGTGEAPQRAVADAIARVCAARGCAFAVELGDNLYDAGASSDRDPQFDTKFEQPYANLTMPFYLVLGNHDNSQDPAGTGASAGLGAWYESGNNEVAYARRTDRASDKWHMDGRHYVVQAGAVQLFALDTNTLLYEDLPIGSAQLAAIREQERWIDAVVDNAPNATWRIAIGHHPYLSNGPHGDAGNYDGRPVPGMSGDYLKTFYETHICQHVDLVLAGHDHNLQWLKPVGACGATQFIVSGGGGASVYDLPGDDAAFFQAATLGFWYIEAGAKELHATAFDQDGKELYTGSLLKFGA